MPGITQVKGAVLSVERFQQIRNFLEQFQVTYGMWHARDMPPDKQASLRYGREVQKLRNDAGLTQTALARRVTCSKSQISDVERGKATPSAQLRTDLDEVLGNGRLQRLWEDLTGSGREAWRYEVTELTHEADALYEYQSLVFPAYLQTEAYAAALVRFGAPWLTADEVATEASERAKGARRMAEAERPKIWLIVDQAVLWRRYGGREVQREQLTRVLELTEHGRVSLQVVPVDSARHPGNSGPRRIITSTNQPDVAFVESAHKGQIITAGRDVEHNRMLFADLQLAALGPDATLTALRDEIVRVDDD